MKLNLISNSKLFYDNKSKKGLNFKNTKFLDEILLEKNDKLTISDEALEIQQKVNEEKEKLEEEAKRIEEEIKHLKEEFKKAREKMEADSKMWKTITKCFIIALRIMMDTKVPKVDEKFLRKNDIKLYSKATALRNNMRCIKAKSNKKYKSILDKEDLESLEDNKLNISFDSCDTTEIENNSLEV